MHNYNLNLENAKKGTSVSISDIELALRQVMRHTNISPHTLELFFKSLQDIDERGNGKRVYAVYDDFEVESYQFKAISSTSMKVNNFWDDVVANIGKSLYENPKPYIPAVTTLKFPHVVVLEQYIQDDEVFYVIRDGVEDLEYSTLSAVERAVKLNEWTVVWGSTELQKPDCNIKWADDIDDPDTITLTTVTANSLTMNSSIAPYISTY